MNIAEAAEFRYRNLAKGQSATFHSLAGNQQARSLRASLRVFAIEWIDSAHFSDLRRSISKGYWYVRLPYFFSPNAQETLEELISETRTQIEMNSIYLGPEEKSLLGEYLTELRQLVSTESPWAALAAELEELGSKLLVVTEQTRWAPYLTDFVNAANRAVEWTPVSAIGYLARLHPKDFDALVFLGSPTNVSDAHARLLLSAGLAPSTHFFIPGFTSFRGTDLETKAFGILKPTLSIPDFKQRSFNLETKETPEELELASLSVAAKSASRNVDLEKLGTTGNEKCILLRIDVDSVIPIEIDAARLSTLVLDPVDGKVKEQQIDWPLQGPGPIVFALIEQGEQDFLWEAAKVEMGEQFLEFDQARIYWISLLKEMVRSHGVSTTEDLLMANGVSTASYINEWLGNEKFTRPRADSDFKALLSSLSLPDHEIQNVMSLTSKYRGELNQIAKTARNLVCDALNAENWRDLHSGENLDVLLEEFGDAVYRVGKVLSISEEAVMVPTSQVRRVVKG
jgi:hypothetical protein